MHNSVVRQPDTDTFRFWEIAGSAHASSEASDAREAVFTRDGTPGALPVGAEQNQVPHAYVRDAALHRFVEWVDIGRPPPSIDRIQVEPGSLGQIVRDKFGDSVGGVRVPDVEAPTATHLGTNSGNTSAALAGSSRPFTTQRLVELYGDVEGYVRAWDGAVDRLVEVELVGTAVVDIDPGVDLRVDYAVAMVKFISTQSSLVVRQVVRCRCGCRR